MYKVYYDDKITKEAKKAKREKRVKAEFEKVPNLEKKDFLTWRDKLLTSLKGAGLDNYIKEVVPEPEDTKEKQQWQYDRIDIDNFIQSTVTDIKVWTALKGQGWNVVDQNPKSTYDHLAQHFDKLTAKATYNLAAEMFPIRRENYDKFATFQNRLNYLYQRLGESDFLIYRSFALLCVPHDLIAARTV
jgi:translation initiation factor RLI1